MIPPFSLSSNPSKRTTRTSLLSVLFVACGMLLSNQAVSAFTFVICNNTDDAVSVDADYKFCLAQAPKIRTLAAKTCAVIDNSYSLFMGCPMNNVTFKNTTTQKELATSRGLSYWDYTYTLEKDASGNYSLDAHKGLMFPVGNKVVTVLKNYSGIGMTELLALTRIVPGKVLTVAMYPVIATLQATMSPGLFSVGSTIGKPLLGAASLAALTYYQYKSIFNSCFRAGKYSAWVNAKDTFNPGVAEYIMTKGMPCDHNCIPNPKVVDIHPATLCSYEVTWDLAKQFPYVP